MTFAIQEAERRPVVAILTMGDKKRVFRGNHENFIDLIAAGRQGNALVYVTTVQDLKPAEPNIHGYLYNFTDKVWKRASLPAPDVVYNRIPTRKDEMKPAVKNHVQACIRYWEPQFFNPYFFNKWTLFEWLGSSKHTRHLIPATCKLESGGDIAAFVRKYSASFLKPELGKAGKGIMKVSLNRKMPHHRMYTLTIQEKRESQKHKFRTASQIWEKIQEYIGQERYILQQGIRLTRYKGRPFDLRVLVQKNAEGRWRITGIGARIAGKLSITTHVPRGGSIDDPIKLLNSVFGRTEGQRIMRKVRKSSLTVARQVERSCGHMLGEMSMDLGIDTLGNVWFFEANSKPMKFDEPDIRKKSLERIIAYSTYLTKKSRSTVPKS